MDCRTTSAQKFRTKLRFKQYDVILTKEQSVLTKIMSSFEGENIKTQYNILGLTYTFMNISSQQKLMKMDTTTEILTTKKKTKNNTIRTWL